MRAAAVALLVLIASPASPHCYSIWRYPTPQRCGSAAAYVPQERIPPPATRALPVPPVRDLRDDLPLPDLTDITWDTVLDTPGQLELMHDMESLQRLKALRRLEEEQTQ